MTATPLTLSRGNGYGRGCIFTMSRKPASASPSSPYPPCNRQVTWRIHGKGDMCSFHYEQYVVSHDVDIAHIERLSDDESDFVVRCEPGKGHSGHHSGHHNHSNHRSRTQRSQRA